MPIHELSEELVLDIVESYGQITKLNLSTNEITRIENLQHLTCLTSLDLCCNRLGSDPGSLDGLAPLTHLKDLDISENSISSLEPLLSAPVSLERLDVANNSVVGTFQISYLASLTALTELVLAGNPVAEEEDYLNRTFTTLPSLESLDNIPREHHDHHHHRHRNQEDGVDSENRARSAHVSSTDASATSQRREVEPYLASPFENMPPPPATSGSNPSPGSSVAPPPSSPGPEDDRLRWGDQTENPSENPPVETQPVLPLPPLTFAGPVVSGSVEAGAVWDGKDEWAMKEASDGGSFRGGSSSSGGSGVFGEEGDGADPGRLTTGQRGMRLVANHSPAIEQASRVDGLEESTPFNSVNVAAAPTRLSRPDESPHPRTRDMGSLTQNPERRAAESACNIFEPGNVVTRVAESGPHLRPNTLPGVPALVEATVTPRVTVGREAHTVSSCGVYDDRNAEDESSREVLLPSRPVRTRRQLPGGGSDRETAVGEQYSEGHPPVSSGSVADGVQTATLRTIRQMRSTRADRAEFCTLSDNGGQDALSRVTSAAATRAPRRVVANAHAASKAGLDRLHDFFDRQGSSFTHTVKPSEQRFSVGSLGAPISGAGVVGVGAADVVDDRNYHRRSGWERAETFELPRQAAVPPKIGGSTHSLGNRASGISSGHVQAARGGGEAQTVVVSRGEWEALKRENDDLRRQATLTEKRCAALSEMQRLADNALASAHRPMFSSSSGATAAVAGDTHARRQEGSRSDALPLTLSSSSSSSLSAGERPEDRSRERSAVDETTAGEEVNEDQHEAGGEGGQADVARLLAAWRAEVLKLLLQRGVDAEVAAEESRRAQRTGSEEIEARGRAEAEAKSLMQRALAAEAEAELVRMKLAHALEELREDRAGRCTAEASSLGHTAAVRNLREWVEGFVARASEGLFEREALLARAVAKLEAFSERLSLAAGRIQVLETLLRHKEVQLRNSRAALVADRRVWLLERRDKELAALSSNAPLRRTSPARATSSGQKQLYPGAAHVGRRSDVSLDFSGHGSSGGTRTKGDGIGDGVHGDVGRVSSGAAREAVAIECPLLEGLRPECEAVMRALFCRVDRLGTGAVRARRLLSVLGSDCGVSEVMEAAVGKSRWRAALDSMEAALCPPLRVDPAGAICTESGGRGEEGGGDGRSRMRTGDAKAAAGSSGSPPSSEERNVTWGEFLLFFLPSAGAADDAYNAGLTFHGGGRGFAGAGGARNRSNGLGAVSEDAAAMLQMVVPDRWTAGNDGGCASRAESGGGAVVGTPATGKQGDVILGRGLAALSVGQLRREVLRLARERGFLLALVREDCRLGKRRAEAVHDQYRHELRAMHSKIGDVKRSLEQVSCRADAEQEKATAFQEELSRSLEEVKGVEQEWRRRMDAAKAEEAAALEESSREASKSATAARERISRLEAQHSLALRENGKASVRQRALERELARIKSSMQAEANVEKEALEERLRAGQSKLATARRERNALLAALRDLQKRGRSGSDPLSLFAPSSDLGASRAGGGGMALQDFNEDSGCERGSAASVNRVDGTVPSVGQQNLGGLPPRASGFAPPVLVAAPGGRARSAQEPVATEVVRPRVSGGLLESGGSADNDTAELRVGGETGEGEWRGSSSRGPVDEDAGRAASLSARLEMLARQTQQLLADGSDTSYSAGDSDSE